MGEEIITTPHVEQKLHVAWREAGRASAALNSGFFEVQSRDI
jgi:hypothetical protein